MANAQGISNALLPSPPASISPMAVRGQIVGTNTYHSFLVVEITQLASGAHLHSGWRWHNELDRKYFQIGWQNLTTGGVREITLDVFLRIDGRADTWAYDTIVIACPLTPVAGTPDYRTIPISGEAQLGSLEFRVDMTVDDFQAGYFECALWCAPERWFSFRTVSPGTWYIPT